MPKNPGEVPADFTHDPGSKDAETHFIEGEERFQARFGIEPEPDANTEIREGMEADAREEATYIKRARLAGDTRSDADLRYEIDDLEGELNAYTKERKVDGTYTDPWKIAVDFAKKQIPSFGVYLDKRQKADVEVDPWSVYLDWKSGKDMAE